MGHLPNGYNVAQTEWDAQDDRINNIEQSVINTGGTVGAATLAANVGFDEHTDTLSSTGSVTVTHGLGWTPAVVLIQMRGNPSTTGPYITYVSTITSSSFIVFFGWRNSGATSWNPGSSGQTVVFDWLAFKP